MKTKFLFISIVFLFAFANLSAQSTVTKANLKVYGNCSMCKVRIETALDRAGIKQAQWNPQTKNLEVIYNSKKISEQRIHEWIAAAGHDTDQVKAPDEVYAKLPFCCLY